jgi:hypothetical protein
MVGIERKQGNGDIVERRQRFPERGHRRTSEGMQRRLPKILSRC